ncbi:MAG TPA: hypothetical protein VFS29_07470 [Motilibacteraceae bacterium]|nr:hypothetical protein [Motilibacteraceae bacterium]
MSGQVESSRAEGRASGAAAGQEDERAAGTGGADVRDRPGRRRSFGTDLRDAVTGRAVALVLGVLALQLGFVASYLGALHAPSPHRIDLAVVAPGGAATPMAQQVAQQLGALPGDPLAPRVAADEAAARRLIDDRQVYGALLVAPTGAQDRLLVAGAEGSAVADALSAVVTRAEQAQGRTVQVTDVHPVFSGDARGLSPFYLVVGWTVGGYLVASILGISAGARPATQRRAVVRLASLALYAVVSGVAGALIADLVLGALDANLLALSAFGALLVFAVGAATMAFQVLGGTAGIGIAILLFVVLGNPSAGGAYPSPLLPAFWRAIGPWLPPGAGTDAVRGIAYFDGVGVRAPALLLAGYAVVGALATLLGAGVRQGRRRAGAAG